MAGLYVHVPFCAQACSYCDFHFTTRLGDRQAMVNAVCMELESALPLWEDVTFETLYFGGGTPSILAPEDLERIAETAFRHGHWNLKEWTLEANPEDLETPRMERWKALGVSRLSIGIQSFEAEVLQWMRRRHWRKPVDEGIREAAALGFEHLSLDLMYGLPVGSEERWAEDLHRACALPVDHLSCYILTAEPRTLYGHQLERGDLVAPPDERVVDEYALLCSATLSAGFEHYEVSNFARTGGRSQHNSAYWQRVPYLGVGPGAHSFRNHQRWWNIRSNAGYMQAANSQGFEAQRQYETLTQKDHYNEALITGLRRKEGVHPEALVEATGHDLRKADSLAALLEKGDCEWYGERLRIPESRWPLGDAITLELMV